MLEAFSTNNLPECASDNTGPCWEDEKNQDGEDETQDVKSSSQQAKLLKLVGKLEGSAYGVTLSGGAEMIDESGYSSNSHAFYVMTAGTLYDRALKNKSLLELTEFAKITLKNGAVAFINDFGVAWAQKITWGFRFIGSYVVKSNDFTSNLALAAFANISANKGLFSGSLSGEINTSLTQSGSKVSTKGNGRSTYVKSQYTLNSLDNVIAAYQEFKENIDQADAAMKLVLEDWRNVKVVSDLTKDWDRSELEKFGWSNPDAITMEIYGAALQKVKAVKQRADDVKLSLEEKTDRNYKYEAAATHLHKCSRRAQVTTEKHCKTAARNLPGPEYNWNGTQNRADRHPGCQIEGFNKAYWNTNMNGEIQRDGSAASVKAVCYSLYGCMHYLGTELGDKIMELNAMQSGDFAELDTNRELREELTEMADDYANHEFHSCLENFEEMRR